MVIQQNGLNGSSGHSALVTKFLLLDFEIGFIINFGIDDGLEVQQLTSNSRGGR